MIKLKKRFIAAAAATIVVFALVFAACGGDPIYTDPAGNTMVAVTDESGNTVLNQGGDIVVYQTDTKGNIATDNSGVPMTLASRFPERLVEGKLVQTPTYTLTMPSGWSVVKDKYNVYKKKSEDALITVEIIDGYTLDEYLEYTESVIELLLVPDDEGGVKKYEGMDTYEYVTAKVTAHRFNLMQTDKEGNTYKWTAVIFEKNGNLYKFIFEAPAKSFDKANFPEFLSAINYKNYKYY